MGRKSTKIIKAGAAQMFLELDEQANYRRILEFIDEAQRLKLDLLVFPECSLTGYPLKETDNFDHVDQQGLKQSIALLKKLTRALKMTVVMGLADFEEGKCWNRALILGPNGRLCGSYDKIHLMPLDQQFFTPGEEITTNVSGRVRMGLQICLDQRMPEPWRVLKRQDAQVVCHLAAAYGSGEWKMPVIEGCLRARASENGYFIVSANAAGPIQMVKSAIYNPQGLLLAQANYGMEQLIYAELDLSQINDGYPSLIDPRSY